ncbi:MAG TPA: fibronectin type III-like domain-contianing protein, partial [Sphingomonas sp.]|uniref:fibronectin type III-like domain-contianing protein n=1 Tax=Sphingomonas sp. TaxID=28214 RepID=UPI002ED9C935
AELPRPKLDGVGLAETVPFAVTYHEGAAVGYKWYDRTRRKPLFPFGHGLSYTQFMLRDLSADAATLTVRATVSNTGRRVGTQIAQFYAEAPDGRWEAPKRLVGWARVTLMPGERRTVTARIDPRLLATWDVGGHRWQIAGGRYRIRAGASSADLPLGTDLTLTPATLPAGYVGVDALPQP